ncbi:DUF5681 domain-containing protein [Methyloceanibacter sp.]|uniref:DUF5681 domain-containing protein n=1 Tax=Methyloceanibacter sp. TaxID=1965321 RepID=UPI003D6CCC8D
MADNSREDGTENTPDPKQSGKPKPLSDEVVEGIKKEILFGAGYKRPPKQHQFKKGQSGNPKGRPRIAALGTGDRSANDLALKQAERLIGVREGEEVKKIPAIEAVFLAQYATASKGNAYAQRHIIERYDRAERERRRQIQDNIESWRQYIVDCREAIAEAKRKDEPPPALLPHPDDVVIDPVNGVRFVGPIVDEEVPQIEQTRHMRDMLLMQDALDWRQKGDLDSDDRFNKPGTALLLATILNQSVPDRLKLSDDEITAKMLRYAHIPKRQLLKDVYRGWRSLGARPPRGKVFPPLRIGKERVELFYELLRRWKDGRLDVLNSTFEELTAEIMAIAHERQQAVK